MKGKDGHVGFPETAYAQNSAKLVEAGYNVARVEQTETPKDMDARKKKIPKGQTKPQVVCREVCSVVSKGTRTYCYLDDVSVLEKGNTELNNGPMVAIKEIMIDQSDEAPMEVDGEGEDDTGTKAVYEYGVTIVDALTGTITLGQFADDILRSRMQTLLASYGPSEVSLDNFANSAHITELISDSTCNIFPPHLSRYFMKGKMVHPKRSCPSSTQSAILKQSLVASTPMNDSQNRPQSILGFVECWIVTMLKYIHGMTAKQ